MLGDMLPQGQSQGQFHRAISAPAVESATLSHDVTGRTIVKAGTKNERFKKFEEPPAWRHDCHEAGEGGPQSA
jgi:hypothetical protein